MHRNAIPRRTIASVLVMTAASAGAVAAYAAAGAAAAADSSSFPTTVTSTLITRPQGTLAPGTAVKSSALGERVFPSATHGFALAAVGQAQYPAATTDGGKTWRTDGPALHLNAAQAPLSVTDVGAATAKTAYFYGSGQVVDTTPDAGKHWYRALFQGVTMAVVPGPSGALVAFVDFSATSSASGTTLQYISRNAGRTWKYDTSVGGF